MAVRDYDKFILRLPPGVRDEIAATAKSKECSMNTEVVERVMAGSPTSPDAETLRDKFAGQALAGLVGNPGGPYQASRYSGWDIVNCDVSYVAATCYRLADAMLAARKGDA